MQDIKWLLWTQSLRESQGTISIHRRNYIKRLTKCQQNINIRILKLPTPCFSGGDAGYIQVGDEITATQPSGMIYATRSMSR